MNILMSFFLIISNYLNLNQSYAILIPEIFYHAASWLIRCTHEHLLSTYTKMTEL